MTRSSGTTTIFSAQTDPGPQPFSFAASIVVHALAFAVAWFAIVYKPPFIKVITDHYSVRKLDLHMPDKPKASARIPFPVSHPNSRKPSPAGRSAPTLAALPQTAKAKLGPQTLVQADLPKPITLTQEIPLPQITIWSPSKVEVKTVQPPQPQKQTSADAKPSVATPNQELNLADINIASTINPTPQNIVQASTTSPVQVHVPDQVHMPPVTSSQSTAEPTPASILSLSDLRAKDQTVTLPPVNETTAANTEGALGSGPAQNSPSDLNNPDAKVAGAGAGPDANASPDDHSGSAGNAPSANPGAGSNSGSDQDSATTATLITVPKDGRFGAVIVGDSLQEQYPEVADIWSGRLAYSAYLHVGLAKSWILQYSLPRSTDASAGGTVVRLDAPWPYSIVRPNLEPGTVDADALMVHGFVDQAGHFETLSIVFPEGFQRAQFVLAALQQWQFRPASRDGQPAKVEVLLIIPEQYE